MNERMAALRKMLEKEPDDLFLLYAVALEHKKMRQFADALKYLGDVLRKDPLYCVAYQQMGQVHELAGDVEAARKAYREGIEAAGKKGDQHAREEMAGALAVLE